MEIKVVACKQVIVDIYFIKSFIAKADRDKINEKNMNIGNSSNYSIYMMYHVITLA